MSLYKKEEGEIEREEGEEGEDEEKIGEILYYVVSNLNYLSLIRALPFSLALLSLALLSLLSVKS